MSANVAVRPHRETHLADDPGLGKTDVRRATLRKPWRPAADVAFLVACLEAAALASPGPRRRAALRAVRALAAGSRPARPSAADTTLWVLSCRHAMDRETTR